MKDHPNTYRCPWVPLDKQEYVDYHDKEWGVPVHDDRLIFEFLTLESAQAGLSWYTVLRKRDNYRKAFNQFDPEKFQDSVNEKWSHCLETLASLEID